MKTFKKLSLALSGIGLITTMTGAVLSQTTGQLRGVGEATHKAGLLLALAGLSTFLYLNISERDTWRKMYLRAGTMVRPKKGGMMMIILARCCAVLLMIAGALVMLSAGVRVAASVGRLTWWGPMGVVELIAALTTFGLGLGLWLIADIASRVRSLHAQSLVEHR